MKIIKEILLVMAMLLIMVSQAQEAADNESPTNVAENLLSRTERAALPLHYGEWPKSGGQVIVPYFVSRDFGAFPAVRDVLDRAIRVIASTTCVRFVPYNSAPRSFRWRAYVRFQINRVRPQRCEAHIGRSSPPNTVSIGEQCGQFIGIVLHELMHTLGFWHEHVRTDRDRYVTINWNNIHLANRRSFQMREGTDNFGSPYDVQSIMHYSGYKLALNRDIPTILNRWTREPIIERVGYQDRPSLSNEDIRQIHAKYRCPIPAGLPARTFPAIPTYDECRDEQSQANCARIKAAGNCSAEAGNMCRLTCEKCLPCDDNRYKWRTTETGIRIDDCAAWSRQGLCESEEAFMRAVCRRTCGWCNNGVQTTTTSEDPVAPVVPVAPVAPAVATAPVAPVAPVVNNNRPFPVPSNTCRDQSIEQHCNYVVREEKCGKNAVLCRMSCGLC